MRAAIEARSLHDHLRRWVSEGLIDDEQARHIEELEFPAAAGAPPVVSRSQGPSAVEVLGYVGALLALIAAVLAVSQLWPDITVGAEMAFAAAACVLLLVAGLAVRVEADPALQRLRSALWFGSAVGLVAFAGLWAGDTAWQSVSVVLLVAAVSSAAFTALWFATRAVAPLLAMFAAGSLLVGAAASRLDTSLVPWTAGIAVWCFSVLWAAGTRTGVLVPRAAAELAAPVGMLVGALLTMSTVGGPPFGIATVAVILTAGVRLDRMALVGVGAIGILAVVPETMTRYLPDSAAAPLAVFVVGLTLVTLAIWLARRRRHRPTDADRSPDG